MAVNITLRLLPLQYSHLDRLTRLDRVFGTIRLEKQGTVCLRFQPHPEFVAGCCNGDPPAAVFQIEADSLEAFGQVRLNGHFAPNDWVAAYAQTFLFAPEDGMATVLFGADDAHVMWVNGERVSERQGRNISRADDLAVDVMLRAGWNRVLLKVADLDGGWAFQVRVADPEGALRWSARAAGSR